LGTVPKEKKGEIASKIILEHLDELLDAFSVFDGKILRIRPV
jgi:hypothetical protein